VHQRQFVAKKEGKEALTSGKVDNVELGIFRHWQSSNLPKLEPNLLDLVKVMGL